ncbi:MAG: hypothetical protein WKG01_21725 [Kofleriaceae bacterium]
MIRIAWLAVFTTVVACGGNGTNDDDNPSDGGPGSDGPSNAIRPRAGGWHYVESTPVSSTCPTSTPSGEYGDFVIDEVGAASFRVVPADGTAPFTCTSTSGFDCPDRATAMRDYRPTIDAVISAHATADGTFSSPVRGTGRQHVTVSCAGTQCTALGNTFPCSIEVAFVIEAR